MKKMKKILAFVMAMAMVLGMSVTSLADGSVTKKAATGKNTDTGVITVNGVEDGQNVKVWAYPIVEADYTGANGYFKEFKVKEGYAISNILAPTETELATIAQKISESEGTPTRYELRSQGDGSYKSEEIALGMYLISIEGSESTAYNPAVASIYYVNDNDNFIIDSDALDMGSVNVASPNTWVKKTETPGLDKKVKKDGETGNGDTHNTAGIGDTLVYTVTIDKIPSYTGKFPVLKVTDTLSKGLKYVPGSMSIKIGDADKTEEYLPVVAGQTITVDFAPNYNYQLSKFAGQSLVITYKAEITKDAAVNEIANSNDVVLQYTKNSLFETEDKDLPTEEKKTYTYTFDLDGVLTGEGKLNKVDTTNLFNKVGLVKTTTSETTTEVKKLLEGATFGLYTDEVATQVYKADVDSDKKAQDYGNIVSDEKGQLHITGLDAGTYYLKEIKAPANYSINGGIFKIVIEATSWDNDGRLTAWEVKFGLTTDSDLKKVGDFAITYDGGTKEVTGAVNNTTVKDEDTDFKGYNIVNTPLSALPSTGGIGTTIFTIGGCAIMIVAAGLFFASRRKSAK